MHTASRPSVASRLSVVRCTCGGGGRAQPSVRTAVSQAFGATMPTAGACPGLDVRVWRAWMLQVRARVWRAAGGGGWYGINLCGELVLLGPLRFETRCVLLPGPPLLPQLPPPIPSRPVSEGHALRSTNRSRPATNHAGGDIMPSRRSPVRLNARARTLARAVHRSRPGDSGRHGNGCTVQRTLARVPLAATFTRPVSALQGAEGRQVP